MGIIVKHLLFYCAVTNQDRFEVIKRPDHKCSMPNNWYRFPCVEHDCIYKLAIDDVLKFRSMQRVLYCPENRSGLTLLRTEIEKRQSYIRKDNYGHSRDPDALVNLDLIESGRKL